MKHSLASKDTFTVIAHRGASKSNPENTKSAFDAALQNGIFGIEMDLQLTQDRVPVIYHDKTLNRINAVKKTVRSLTYQELQGMDFGSWFHRRFKNERILSLKEVIQIYARKTHLFLELKERSYEGNIMLADQVMNSIISEGIEKSAYILCFDRLVLDYCIKKNPNIRYIHNLAEPPRKTRSILDLYEQLFAVCIHLPALTSKFSLFMQALHKPIYIFTCNRPQDFERASRLGASGLMSDSPEWLGNYINKKTKSYETKF